MFPLIRPRLMAVLSRPEAEQSGVCLHDLKPVKQIAYRGFVA